MSNVFIDAGHGGKDSGAVGNGLQEKDLNLTIALEVGRLLKAKNVNVTYARQSDVFLELSERANKANNIKADIFVSIHVNAAGNATANGVETFHYPTSSTGKKLASDIQGALVDSKVFKANRGVKSANFAVLRLTKMPAALVELGFITNVSDAQLLKTKKNEMAQGVVNGILKYLNMTGTPTPKGYNIKSKINATVEQMEAWAKTNKAHDKFVELAQVYYDISNKVGVNPLVTYAQSAKETGFFKFGGVIDITYNNPCGLKISAGGGNYDPSAHKRFRSWEEGIQAQVDHLALYAGISGYPKAGTPDPRHFPYLKGTAPTVESLGGKWAPSATYGNSILTAIKAIERTPKPVNPNTGNIKMTILGSDVTVKGIVKDQVNYLLIDKSYIPVRSIFEAMGLEVSWDQNSKKVVVK